jgi:hypothetical protein
MKILIFKAPCPVCRKVVFHAKEYGSPVQYFEVKEAKMLVIVATPEVDGKTRIALGPCRLKEPFHGENEEPVIYFGHPKHGCRPLPITTEANRIDASTGTSMSNSGQIPMLSPEVAPPISVPVKIERHILG